MNKIFIVHDNLRGGATENFRCKENSIFERRTLQSRHKASIRDNVGLIKFETKTTN